MAIRATNYDETQEYDVAETGDLCNDNLLINSDFRNPVNQRGKTSYTLGIVWTYAIDRWCGFYNKVSVEDGYIKIEQNASNSGTTYFKQMFENTLPKDNYTVTMNVLELSGTITLVLAGVSQTLMAGKNTFTFEGCSPTQLQINITGSGAYVNIEYIKLEQGSIATPFVPRPYGEELALCQRYLFPIERWVGTYAERGDNLHHLMFVPNLIMRTNPTATEAPTAQIAGFKNNGTVIPTQSVSNFSACYQRKNGIEIVFNIDGTSEINFGVGVFTKDFFLDAEIY